MDIETIQQYNKPKKGHRRQVSDFEEEGRENLSSEGNENDTHEDVRIANQPKIPHEPKFNDFNKKFQKFEENLLSRNKDMGPPLHFNTDKPTDVRNYLNTRTGLSNKLSQYNAKQPEINNRRPSNKTHALNRSRNRGRHTESDSSN